MARRCQGLRGRRWVAWDPDRAPGSYRHPLRKARHPRATYKPTRATRAPPEWPAPRTNTAWLRSRNRALTSLQNSRNFPSDIAADTRQPRVTGRRARSFAQDATDLHYPRTRSRPVIVRHRSGDQARRVPQPPQHAPRTVSPRLNHTPRQPRTDGAFPCVDGREPSRCHARPLPQPRITTQRKTPAISGGGPVLSKIRWLSSVRAPCRRSALPWA